MITRQTTIQRSVSINGIGLHTGAAVHLRLSPAPAYTGIVFRRVDLDGFEIPASPELVTHVHYATALVHKGVLIATVEHLLAALQGCGVDNVYVELDNMEIPIVDGSAQPFVELVRAAAVIELDAPRQYLRILRRIEVAQNKKFMAISPASALTIECAIEFDHPLIGYQQYSFQMSERNFVEQIAPARTFGFVHEFENLRGMGLIKGGSLQNAIALTRDGMMNAEPLRLPNEFVRHKILDIIGDLTLLGRPVLGHIQAIRSGHALHNALVSKLLSDPQAWEIIEAPAHYASAHRTARWPTHSFSAEG